MQAAGHVPWGGSVKRKLMDSLVEANKWRAAFKEVAALMAGSGPGGAALAGAPGREPDVQLVVEAVQRMRKQNGSMQEELKELRRREAALQVALAERNLEAAELRREAGAAVVAGEASVVQLKQLLLDPAVSREYARLKGELEEAQRDVKKLQEELAVAHFSQESKIGRQLMTKCRALADENEEMGRELTEGKVHQLEAQLTLSKGFADELRAQLAELAEHCTALNEEMEGLQRESFALRRKISAQESEGPGGGGDFVFGGRRPGGDMGPGGGPPHQNMGPPGGGYRGRGRGPFRGRGGMGMVGGGRGGGEGVGMQGQGMMGMMGNSQGGPGRGAGWGRP
ncbi:hypothetical protein V8C86DRAFT_3110040 [Haematococcus lacustris]